MLSHECRHWFEAESLHRWCRALQVGIATNLRQHLPAGSRMSDAGCSTDATLALPQAQHYRSVGFDLPLLPCSSLPAAICCVANCAAPR